jgi:hypothetical protein
MQSKIKAVSICLSVKASIAICVSDLKTQYTSAPIFDSISIITFLYMEKGSMCAISDLKPSAKFQPVSGHMRPSYGKPFRCRVQGRYKYQAFEFVFIVMGVARENRILYLI